MDFPSFDAIFPRVSENFAVENPAFRIMVQEAASRTLTAKDDNKSRARKLFLLEKLAEPSLAPPVVPKAESESSSKVEDEIKAEQTRLANKVDWAQQKKNVNQVRQSMRTRGASTVKKKVTKNRPLTARYDPNATALELRIGESNKFYPVSTLAHDIRLENWGLGRFRKLFK